jgi:ankyrin repeat protein
MKKPPGSLPGLICAGDFNAAAKKIKNGADINKKDDRGMTVLMMVVGNIDDTRTEKIINFLVEHGADLDKARHPPMNKTPLHIAIERGNIRAAECLLRHGCDPAAQDVMGKAPLHYAAIGYNRDCIFLLTKAGADINARDKDGRTPLHEAARRGKERIITRLLEAGADPCLKDRARKTPDMLCGPQ